MIFEPRFFNLEYIYFKVYVFFENLGLVKRIGGDTVFLVDRYVFYLKLFLIFVSVFMTFMIIDFFHRLLVIRREEQSLILERILKNIPSEERENQRWNEVQRLISSENESDLKLAIIEADKMLEHLLTILGYKGETIGEKLQAVEKGDMQALDDAWEAHKFRNRIAHEAGLKVTSREAKRIIGKYANVFREYQYI